MTIQEDLNFPEKWHYMPPEGFAAREWQREAIGAFKEKLRNYKGPQFRFLFCAGVGSGKTLLAAQVVSLALNLRYAERILYVSPNKNICQKVQEVFRSFGIHLVQWNNKKHRHGEGAAYNGAIMTYQSLSKCAERQRSICRQKKTLVIFDEIHHLGDPLAWGISAQEAFSDPSTLIVGLSGTPFRSDNKKIPFVETETTERGLIRYRADYAYPICRAIADHVCKQPRFWFLDAKISIAGGRYEGEHLLTEECPEELTSELLRAAVAPGSGARKDALKVATEACREEGRKLIIFVSGDAANNILPTDDAETYLPAELRDLGISDDEILSVTSENKDAAARISEFGASKAWILCTVNMVSEGVDIPELSAALFLTTITAKSASIQRTGRVLRNPQGGIFDFARIFMFKAASNVTLATEFEQELQEEFRLKEKRAREGQGSGGFMPSSRVEAIGVRAWLDGVCIEGQMYPQEVIDAVESELREKGCPLEWLPAALKLREKGITKNAS